MEKFNNNLKQFTEQIIKLFPEQKEQLNKYYNFDNLLEDKYLHMFYSNCMGKGDDISSKNEIIFSEESVLLENINFFAIWNSDRITDENKENIWKYLHTLYIFAYETVKERDIKTILKELKNISSDSENLDEDTKTLLNIIDSLTGKYTDGVELDSDDEDEPSDESSTFAAPELFNGVIGDLAKEIAGEINTDDLNLDNPAQLLKDLMSGNFDENDDKSGIVNLVKNITSKIQSKLSKGTLDESQLFTEAQNVMKTFSNGNKSGGSNPMENILSKLMSGMGGAGGMPGMEGLAGLAGMPGMEGLAGLAGMPGMEGLAGVEGFAGMDNVEATEENDTDVVNAVQQLINNGGKGNNVSSNQVKNNVNKQRTRDRLKKKLQDKKNLLKEKESKLELKKSNNFYEEDIDLDALAAEIEGMSSGNKTTSKSKKQKKKTN